MTPRCGSAKSIPVLMSATVTEELPVVRSHASVASMSASVGLGGGVPAAPRIVSAFHAADVQVWGKPTTANLKSKIQSPKSASAVVRRLAEILASGGIKPLQTTMEGNSRQGDLADQASGNNEVHIQLKLKQTDAKILQAIEDARDSFEVKHG